MGTYTFLSKDPSIGYKTINARAETVAHTPSFRESFKSQRCLIPADGLYEVARDHSRSYTQNPSRCVNECNGDITTVDQPVPLHACTVTLWGTITVCVWYHLHTDQDPKFFAAIKTILLDQILVLTATQP